MTAAINVEGVSKRYRIQRSQPGRRAGYRTLRESLTNICTAPFRTWRRTAAERVEDFWALSDVSFEVDHGEAIGIIGRNGAGKSTLLKILTRITQPTSGRARLRGRVGSLLEVGTGFHPELTGRENIFLNGSILGMPRRTIQARFDEIVDFSGVEKFIDTPIKRYSSGMTVRLAFSVAAHLEPEILIVDEVLAVGDVVFQKKCLGKMNEVASGGRTVLFVSHNMSGVVQLCTRGLLLDQGRMLAEGPILDVVTQYVQAGLEHQAEISWPADNGPGDGPVHLQSVRVLNADGQVDDCHYLADPVTVELEFLCGDEDVRLNPSIHLLNSHGVCLFAASNLDDPHWGQGRYSQGVYRGRCTIPGHLLNEGNYRVSVFVSRNAREVLVKEHDLLSFHVVDDGSGRGDYTGGWIGVIRPQIPWQIEHLQETPA